jgi:hypothetical protein
MGNLMGCSPGRSGLSSSQGWRRARIGSGERGKSVVRSEGGARLLYGSGVRRGGVAGGG